MPQNEAWWRLSDITGLRGLRIEAACSVGRARDCFRPAGMAYAALATSSVAVLVLSLHTIQALLMGGVFVMVSLPAGERLPLTRVYRHGSGLQSRAGWASGAEAPEGIRSRLPHAEPVTLARALCAVPAVLQDPKYGPLSQQILTHEAFRAAGQRLKAAAAALGTAGKAGAVNPAALADFALQVRGCWALGLASLWPAMAPRACCLTGLAAPLDCSTLDPLPALRLTRRRLPLPLQFRRYRLAHAWHAHHEDSVIFK